MKKMTNSTCLDSCCDTDHNHDTGKKQNKDFFAKLFAKPDCGCSTCGPEDTPEACDTSSTCAIDKQPNEHPHNEHAHGHSHDHDDEHAHSHGDDGHSHDIGGLSQKAEAIFLGICVAFFFLLLVLEDTITHSAGVWTVRVLYCIPYFLCGFPILREAVNLIRKGDVFNEFTLMSMASLVAIGLGETAEAVGVILFYRIGEHIQERAAGSSRRSIESLLASKPAQARILVNSEELIVPVEDVQVGQEIIVKAGEKIPLDGIIISGMSDMDQSPLTGESIPVQAKAGTKALGGAINLSGLITIKVESVFANSHMARILDMIATAAKRKSPTERFITRFARYYTPAVVAIAIIVAVIPPLIIKDALFTDWLYRALVMLVISCPCALLISVPLGYFGGIGAASRKGILVKGGNVFDDCLSIKTVVFDKTGTLTEGKFSVSELAPAPSISEEQLLKAAVIAELHASHPIANAIIKKAKEIGLDDFVTALLTKKPVTNEIPGKGMEVELDGKVYLAGRLELLEEKGMHIVKNTNLGAIVYIAEGTTFLGSILVSDSIKKDAKSTIAALKNAGLTTIMLTGDREEAAQGVAKVLELDQYKAGLLPEGKVEALEALADINTTLFVGDGINDAPVLAMSRVGVAMGAIGAEAAIEVADAVILNDSPAMVQKLLSISKDVRNIVWQNIFLALGVKTIVMGFGIAGVSGLWEAIFADVGVALLAVLNSTRISWK